VTSRNPTVLMLTVGVLFSASVFRVFRAATLEIRQELFVTAARTSGLSDLAILRRHVLPRLGALLIIQGAIAASVTLVIQVGLGFLSIDARPPSPSWGNMVATASQTISTTIWPLIPPAVVIGLTVLAFSAISDVAQQARTGRGRPVGLGGSMKLVSPRVVAAEADGRVADTGAARRPQPLLSIDDLTVSVPGPDAKPLTLVEGISLDVAPGEIVGLVGESGAGKSITARAILGIVAQGAEVSGSIRYKGTELLGLPEKQLATFRGSEIAFVGQDPAVSLSPSYRIGHQVAEIVRLHRGVTRKEAAAAAVDLLDQVRISDPKATARLYPHQVSGGMAQRVVIALALAGNPKMLIADEPTTALDVSVQMQILGLLKGLQRDRSLAMLIVTHDWGVIADVCDRAVVMYAGQVVEEASVGDIFERPLHPYSAALRSADPHLQTVGDRLRVIEGQVPAPGTWPTGCRFAERCSFAIDHCRSAPVDLDAHGADRLVRCIRVDELGSLGANDD
jgi:peptide/nickel transport system permease protein